MAQVGTRPRRTVEEQELLARLEGRELTEQEANLANHE